MELKLIPYKENLGVSGGILIKSPDIRYWIQEISRMGLQVAEVDICPLPDKKANEIWGCLLRSNKVVELGQNNYCRLLADLLFIPEYSSIYPMISDVELANILNNKKHLFHPEIGLYCIEEIVDVSKILSPNRKVHLQIEKPQSPILIPEHIITIEIKLLSSEDILQQMESEVVSEKKTFDNKPLNSFEKVKMNFYKMFWKEENNEKQKTKLQEALSGIIGESTFQKTKEDLEELEARNKEEIEKLMELFENNIEEALEYAIPLNESGSFRGPLLQGSFRLERNQYAGRGQSGTLNLQEDVYASLRDRYKKAAEELLKQNNFKKAAYIYMKLLRDYFSAATSLEEGKLYKEAAAIYLEHLGNKLKAAQCFEKAGLIDQAIAVYKQMEEQEEKIGDLYLQIGLKAKAMEYFYLRANYYTKKKQFLKASLIYRYKMQETQLAQNILLEGWRTHSDAFNCLNSYLNSIQNIASLENEIKSLYRNEVNSQNEELFISVLESQFKKDNSLTEYIREIAYEIIAKRALKERSIVSRLIAFNKDDSFFAKDTMRYRYKS